MENSKLIASVRRSVCLIRLGISHYMLNSVSTRILGHLLHAVKHNSRGEKGWGAYVGWGVVGWGEAVVAEIVRRRVLSKAISWNLILKALRFKLY